MSGGEPQRSESGFRRKANGLVIVNDRDQRKLRQRPSSVRAHVQVARRYKIAATLEGGPRNRTPNHTKLFSWLFLVPKLQGFGHPDQIGQGSRLHFPHRVAPWNLHGYLAEPILAATCLFMSPLVNQGHDLTSRSVREAKSARRSATAPSLCRRSRSRERQPTASSMS